MVTDLSKRYPASKFVCVGFSMGGNLIHMAQQYPEARFVGIGGPKMAAAGVHSWFPLDKLSVRGYVEVLRHYREIVGIRREVKRRFLAERPVVFIGVDAPDFNLDLELALKNAGMDPSEIDYVNAHGTSTPKGDEGEAGAVERTFGDHAKNLSERVIYLVHGADVRHTGVKNAERLARGEESELPVE